MKKIFYLTALAVLLFASCTKPGNNPNEERKYSFSIGANKEHDTNSSSGTRVEIINEDLYWSVGDKVGMFVGNYTNNTGELQLDDFVMTGLHSEPVKSTTFSGELTYDQISQFDPDDIYAYTSYHPYDMYVDVLHINGYSDEVYFEIPYSMELMANEFPSQYALMYARSSITPITWLDDDGTQRWRNQPAVFYYEHVLSYMRLKINTSETSNPVTSIYIESDPGNTNLSDIYMFNTRLGHYNISSNGGHSVNRTRQITIPNGLNVGDELFIPIVGGHYGADIRFSFTFEDGSYVTKLVPASINPLLLNQGQIHTITFNLSYPIISNEFTLDDYIEGQDLGIIN